MASAELVREFSAAGREAGFTGGDLSNFVTTRCEKWDEQQEREFKLAELRAAADERSATASASASRTDFGGPKLKVGLFDETRDKFDAYITKFELVMESQRVPVDARALYLISNLTGHALEVVDRMSRSDRNEYSVVKQELLEHYNLTADGYRKRFRTARPEKGEQPKQFVVRLKGYLEKWVEMSQVDEEFELLFDLILREQFMHCCPKGVELFVKEGQCASTGDVVARAMVYVGAHGVQTFGPLRNQIEFKPSSSGKQGTVSPSRLNVAKGKGDFGSKRFETRGDRTMSKERSLPGVRGCYMCGSPSHFRRDCPLLAKVQSAQGLVEVEGVDSPTPNEQGGSVMGNEVTGSAGSLRSDDGPPHVESLQIGQAGICLPQVDLDESSTVVRAGENELDKLGMAYDQIGAMMKHMPVVSGRLVKGNRAVSVLRDTGCSTCVVKSGLVDADQLTGAQQSVVLIDGTVRQFSVARVLVDSPFYVGEVEALCMPNSLCDVVIGNITGAREPHDPNLTWVPEVSMVVSEVVEQILNRGEQADGFPGTQEDGPTVMAVETRSQKEAKGKPLKGLKVGDPISCVKPADFVEEQKNDPLSQPVLSEAGSVEKSEDMFVSEGHCRCRQRRNECDPSVGVGHRCVVLPVSQRKKVMRMVHESLMGVYAGEVSDESDVVETENPPMHEEEFIEHVKVTDSLDESHGKELSLLLWDYQDVPKKSLAVECRLHWTSEKLSCSSYVVPQGLKWHCKVTNLRCIQITIVLQCTFRFRQKSLRTRES